MSTLKLNVDEMNIYKCAMIRIWIRCGSNVLIEANLNNF